MYIYIGYRLLANRLNFCAFGFTIVGPRETWPSPITHCGPDQHNSSHTHTHTQSHALRVGQGGPRHYRTWASRIVVHTNARACLFPRHCCSTRAVSVCVYMCACKARLPLSLPSVRTESLLPASCPLTSPTTKRHTHHTRAEGAARDETFPRHRGQKHRTASQTPMHRLPFVRQTRTHARESIAIGRRVRLSL